jgi:hypothetical protein
MGAVTGCVLLACHLSQGRVGDKARQGSPWHGLHSRVCKGQWEDNQGLPWKVTVEPRLGDGVSEESSQMGGWRWLG